MAKRWPVVRSYGDLVELLKRRRHQLGVNQLDLDEKIGWASAYSSKLEAPDGSQGRRATGRSLFEWLEGLGLGLRIVVLEDPHIQHIARGRCGSQTPSRHVA